MRRQDVAPHNADKSQTKSATALGQGMTMTMTLTWFSSIENTLHWTLDIVFNEDQSTVGKDHAPRHMTLVRHVVLNLLNTAKKYFKGIGVKALRKKAGWGNATLRLILKHSF